MELSENELTKLAKTDPKELSKILTSLNASFPTLVFGAEILGNEVSDESLVLPPLRILLKHINAVVRESAMIGISGFYQAGKKPPQDVLNRLNDIKKHDPSPTLRDLAKDLLEDWK